jgi:hypothetical protein
VLLGRAAEQHRQQTQQRREHRQRHVGVDAVELLGQHRHVQHSRSATAERHGDDATQKAGLDHLLVDRSGRDEALERARQVARGRADLAQHRACEATRRELQFSLFSGQGEVDRHGRLLVSEMLSRCIVHTSRAR